METVMSVNGRTANLLLGQPLLSQYSENSLRSRLTVQQALSKWYGFLKTANSRTESTASLFEDFKITGTLKSLQADLAMLFQTRDST
jgi:hypothetical protein